MSTPLHDALAARDAAFAALDAADWKAETKEIVAAILLVAERAAMKNATFSAHDVRDLLPEDVNAHRVGRAFKLAQDREWIRAVDLVRSNAPSTRGHHVFRYRLVVEAAAREVAA